MRKIYLIATLLLCVTAAAIADLESENGKAGRTGSPGESTCHSCHSDFTENTGGGSIVITSNMTNWQYMPGQTYQVTVTVNRTGSSVFGFGLEALKNSDNTDAGTLVITNATETQIKTATVSGTTRNNVVHKMDGGFTPNSHAFTFNWTAPMSGVGNITLYSSSIAGNHNGSESGDYVYTTSHVITPNTTGVAENNLNSQLNIFPNPAKDFITVKSVDFVDSSPVEINLCSLNGKTVMEKSFTETTAHSVKIKLDIGIANGMYLLKVRNSENSYTDKILVAR